jgi:hypothetical protein
VYILYIKFFYYFQILDEEVFLELSLKDLVSHLKRLNGMGLEDSKILQAVKCWVIHSVDDRQTMGYIEITYHITHCLSVIYTMYHPGEITYHITHCFSPG